MRPMPSRLLDPLLASMLLVIAAGESHALPSFGTQVDRYCAENGRTPSTPYGGDCSICHNPVDPGADRTEGFNRYLQGDLDHFCPAAPANQAPRLEPIGDQTVSEDGLLSIRVIASDPDNDALLLEATGVPTGAVFSDHGDGTGEFDWMPGFDRAGTYQVVFRVTDDGSPPATDSETITISVGNVNRPPWLDPIGNRSVMSGDLLSFTVSATDPDGDGLFFGTAGLPATAEFIDHADGNATFSWTPDSADAGNVSVTFSVTDDGIPMGSDSEDVVISVGMGQNRPPVLDPIGDRSLQQGDSLQLILTASDPDNDALAFACDPRPSGADWMDRGDGSAELFWQPSFDQSGNFPMTCSVTDFGSPPASDSETFTITVGEVNRPPVLAPVALVMDGDTYLIPLTANDPDGDALRFTVEGEPTGSTMVDYGDGTAELRWTPAPGEVGAFDVLFTATDDGVPPESDSELFTIVVEGEPIAAELDVRRAVWNRRRGHLRVSGEGAERGAIAELKDADGGSVLGETTADRRGRFRFDLRMDSDLAPCAIEVRSGASGSGPIEVHRAPTHCFSSSAILEDHELDEDEWEHEERSGLGSDESETHHGRRQVR